MSRRNWGFIAAVICIAVIFIGAVLLLVERQAERDVRDQIASQQYEDTKRALPPGVIAEGKRSVPDQQSYRDEWRSERSLQAQREMADWAFYTLIVSGVAIIITAFGVVYVALTLDATRASVKVMRDGNERMLRAYVSVFNSKRSRPKANEPWVVDTQLVNGGQTPAYCVRIAARQELVPVDDLDTFEFVEPTNLVPQGDIGPGQHFVMRQEIHLLEKHWRAFKDGEVWLFVWGRVEFVDAFGNLRWMRYRLFQMGESFVDMRTYEIGNNSSESQDFASIQLQQMEPPAEVSPH